MHVRDLVAVSASVLWAASTAAATLAFPSKNFYCEAVNLPPGGILYLPGSDPITLTATAAYRPVCTPSNGGPAIVGGSRPPKDNGSNSSPTTTNSLTTDGDINNNLTNVNIDESTDATPRYSDFRDPFYASTFPQCFALASTTVIAYTLVIMLFITPRSFLDGGVVVLGRRGFTNGGSGGQNIGGRPWLQKVAALTVAISLTIATADTFRVAERQYSWGIQNAKEMQDEVLGGTQLKVIRIISDTFLWLAQAQTLIRLFPRQREKVIIKWTAFSLIILYLIFDCLNSFLYTTTNHSFTDAIPALSYLFELALGVLYAAWVIYYSLMKKRYAFYHPQMRNICLVAFLSLLAILVPVVFFVLDICKPDFTGWGDYVLWVGAAAASVIVWEWVERIEALEREEKRDGILGREVFDGDEMLDIMPSDFSWPRRRRKTAKDGKDRGGDGKEDDPDGGDDDKTGRAVIRIWPAVSAFARRYRLPTRRQERRPTGRTNGEPKLPNSERRRRIITNNVDGGNRSSNRNNNDGGNVNGGSNADGVGDANFSGRLAAARRLQPPLWPSRPVPVATPVSRTDTASADSTVYVMRYHPVTEGSPLPAGGPPQLTQPGVSLSRSDSSSTASSSSRGRPSQTARSSVSSHSVSASALASASPPPPTEANTSASERAATTTTAAPVGGRGWRSLTHVLPFRRAAPSSRSDDSERAAPPFSPHGRDSNQDDRFQHEAASRWDIRSRLEEFAVTQAERLREKIRPTVDTTNLPVMVIPAPQRHGAILAQVLEEEESSYAHQQQQQQQQLQQQSWLLAQARLQQSANSSSSRSAEAVARADGHALWRSESDASAASSVIPRTSRVRSASPADEGPPAVVAAALSRASSSLASHERRSRTVSDEWPAGPPRDGDSSPTRGPGSSPGPG
ncbi:pH signal transduction protein [Niveomyces insectorum RCEF 264]|uniref:pH signal transduction protein n=1 Tax=Niveomyces insectorum RCEF 264 TaxID=1081102 RepID=A0A162MFU9_9HYPO|nr:pH signal transduction protein [Niveomyces insectorum RCEF 264]